MYAPCSCAGMLAARHFCNTLYHQVAFIRPVEYNNKGKSR